jgi:hypothetical protein
VLVDLAGHIFWSQPILVALFCVLPCRVGLHYIGFPLVSWFDFWPPKQAGFSSPPNPAGMCGLVLRSTVDTCTRPMDSNVTCPISCLTVAPTSHT